MNRRRAPKPLQDPVFRRRWAIAALCVLLAVTTVVVLVDYQSHPAVAAMRPASAATPPASPAGRHVSPSVRGRITAINGDVWTLLAADGSTLAVNVDAETVFGTPARPAVRSQLTVGDRIAVTGPRTGETVHADQITIPLVRPTTGTPPTATAPPPAPATSPPAPATALNVCAVNAGLQQAITEATSRGEQAAIAFYDTETGTYNSAGDADTEYSTASVVKVLIATDLLLTGQMNGQTADTAYQMITASDDDAADALYGLVGGDSVLTTIADHYSITNLGSPPADSGQWGETRVTADGLVHLYAALKADPTVWPWLSNAMANATQDGADGTNQYFGIPSAAQDWSVKQGWMTGLGPGSTYDSTGYVDGNRFAVVIFTYGSVDQYGQYMSDTITQMAKDAMPGGVFGSPTPACPA